jgi:menaquinone-dependent protoporphyrinogen oxidase
MLGFHQFMPKDSIMTNPILIAYATKYGATEEIAAKIGDTLKQAGLSVEVLPADQVKDAAAYSAIVTPK